MLNEGDKVKYQGVSGVVHIIANNSKLIIQLETGEILWDVEPRDIEKAEQVT